MATQTTVSVMIGATLGGTFKTALGSAQNSINALGGVIKKFDNDSKQISSFRQLQKATLKTNQEWKQAQSEVSKLAREISTTDKPSKTLQSNFNKAKKEASLAKQAFLQNKNATREMGDALTKAGINTSNLTKEQTRLIKSSEVLRLNQSKLAKIQTATNNNLARRSAFRSQIGDVMALGASLYGIIRPAVAFESAMADVKKVVDFETPTQIKEMEQDIKRLAKTIPLSLDGLASIVASGGQLGIPRQELAKFAETAAKMSVAMDMSADEAGQAMAKLSNVLQVPIGEIGKVGDVVNHLSNNIAATAPEIVEINLRAGAMSRSFGLAYNEVSALAGTFVAMGKSPEIAGTAINMMASRLQLLPVASGKARDSFDELGISMSEYKNLIETGQGQEALLTVLEALKNVQGVKRAEIMKNIFGEQAQRHVNSLVESLDTYKDNIKLVSSETAYAGSMQQEFEARSATTANNIQLLKNNVAILATNIGSVLLPAINKVIAVFTNATAKISDFANKYPVLTQYIGIAVASLMALKIGVVGIGYAFTFLASPVLMGISVFTKLQTVFALAKVGALSMLPAIKAVGVAFLTNPIGLLITGIALGAILLIKYWKPISGFFQKLFTPVIAVFKNVWEWVGNLWQNIQSVFDGIKNCVKDSVIGKAWNFMFGEDDKKEEDSKTNKPVSIGSAVADDDFSNAQNPATIGSAMADEDSSIPTNQHSAVSLEKASIKAGSQNNVSISAPITVNTTAGMNPQDVAREIDLKLKERENQATRRQRAINYD
ncbi:MAG: phage tail tape measure protein [Alphaproteobacteria bacterium]